MDRKWLALIVLVSGLGLGALGAQAADSESQAAAAERAGNLREAMGLYVEALQSAGEGSTADQQLREKIIAVAAKLKPPPAVPEDARRFAIRGQTAARDAKRESDYVEAAQEIGKALRLAPWWADSYFNLAIVQEKAGQYAAAMRSLKLYLLAAPDAPDAAKVKDQIYALEYLQERARKEAGEKSDVARRQEGAQAQREAQLAPYLGDWNYVKQTAFVRAWGTVRFARSGEVVEAHMSAQGFQVQGNRAESVAGPPELILRGSLAEGDPGEVRWQQFRSARDIAECKTYEGFVPATVSMSGDQRRITVSMKSLMGQGYPVVCREYSETLTLTRQ